MDIAEKLIRAKADLDDVYEAGKKLSNGAFWEVFQNNGEKQSYIYAFSYNRFNDETFKPKYDIVCNTANSSATSMFYNTTAVTTVPVAIDVRNTISIGSMFYNASKMKTVSKIKIDESVTGGGGNAFYKCEALKNITFEGVIGTDIDIHWSPLSKESTENIISCLSDAVTGKALSLNKAAVSENFNEAEWEEVVNLKPNWTISLL